MDLTITDRDTHGDYKLSARRHNKRGDVRLTLERWRVPSGQSTTVHVIEHAYIPAADWAALMKAGTAL